MYSQSFVLAIHDIYYILCDGIAELDIVPASARDL